MQNSVAVLSLVEFAIEHLELLDLSSCSEFLDFASVEGTEATLSGTGSAQNKSVRISESSERYSGCLHRF